LFSKQLHEQKTVNDSQSELCLVDGLELSPTQVLTNNDHASMVHDEQQVIVDENELPPSTSNKNVEKPPIDDVNTQPQFIRQLKDIYVCNGESVHFECAISAEVMRNVSIEWTKNGQSARNDPTIRIESKSDGTMQLNIDNCVDNYHTSVYRCSITTQSGTACTEARLYINKGDRPHLSVQLCSCVFA
jgi:hypothetical protein